MITTNKIKKNSKNNKIMKNKLNKGYVYPIYPTKEQIVLLEKTFGCVRFLYNQMLDEMNVTYKEQGKSKHSTPKQYKELYPFLKEVDSLALCNAEIHLNTAFAKFFKKESGYPKFKKKGIHDSYTTNAQKSKSNGLYSIRVVDNKHILFPKLGVVKTKQHRKIGENEIIKNATFSKVAGKYYVSIDVEYENNIIPFTKESITINDCIGLDYSSPYFAIDNYGNVYDHNKYFRESEKKLAKAQRKLSKMEKGSNNYKKQKQKISKIHQKIANQRKDFLHKLSNELTNKYKLICFEDINFQNMARSLKLAKNTYDNGFGMFRTFCEYKAFRKGGYTIKVDKFFASTKTCSVCGYKNKEITLSTKEWICPNCGVYHLRDDNAATNICKEGYRLFLAM